MSSAIFLFYIMAKSNPDTFCQDICELLRKHDLKDVTVIQAHEDINDFFDPDSFHSKHLTFEDKLRKVLKWCEYQKSTCNNIERVLNKQTPENNRPWLKVKNGIENMIDSLIQVIEQDKDYDEEMDMTPTKKEILDLTKNGNMDFGELNDIRNNSEFGSYVLSSLILFLNKPNSNTMIQRKNK